VRLHPELLAALDRWIVETEGGLSRPAAIRVILANAPKL
jgi:hypothetical protein